MDASFGIACGLTGSACWGLLDSCATLAARRAGTLVTSTGMQVAALIPLVVLCVVTGQPIPTAGPLVAQALCMGLISAVGYLLTYEAFRLGPIAVVSPVIAAYGGLSVVLAILLLGELVRPLQACGVVAATIGIALSAVVLDPQWRRSHLVGRGVPFAVGAFVIWAVTVVGFATPIRELGWLPTLTISRFASTVALLFVAAASLVKSRLAGHRHSVGDRIVEGPTARVPSDLAVRNNGSIYAPRRGWLVPVDRTAVILIVTMGWLDVLGFSVWSVGLAATAAWLVGITGSLGPIVTVTFGLVVLGERLRPNQWLGVGGILAGIILIAAA